MGVVGKRKRDIKEGGIKVYDISKEVLLSSDEEVVEREGTREERRVFINDDACVCW